MTAAPDSLQQRYEAIEQVYSERQWDAVAHLSEALLLELPIDPGHPLRQRLQLLLGHTYLYGYEDPTTASGFYSRVRDATQEPVLLDIAEQGLGKCASLLNTSPAAAEEPTPEVQAAAPETAAGGQSFPMTATPVADAGERANGTAAMPWLELLAGEEPATAELEPVLEPVVQTLPELEPVPELELEVVDEPELIAVAQANPATAEQLEVAVRELAPGDARPDPAEPVAGLSPEESAELAKGLLRVVIR
ncbi:MAG: hypothetical protein VKK97_04650 [Synechococcaceae cyanobacterium]|nr:hypothetical protein [Synechococcaceae cyanobacterium]